jgi:regulator of CtrA degradation
MSEHTQFAKFINRTFDETMQLLEEARDYSILDWKEEVRGLPNDKSMRVTSERMRLTARLSEIMAWVMVQKAVADGEMTAEQAQSHEYHLSAHDVCLADNRDKPDACPERLGVMLDRSRDLYSRVIKMDQMASRLFTLGA